MFAQSYRPLEVIVVDDGSEDDTWAVAKTYGDRIRFARQARGGAGAARNVAVGLANGAYLAFLDADDRFTPTKLEHQLAALDADLALDMVFGHVREFVSPELPPEARAKVRPPAPPSPWTSPSLMLIRRASFDRVGPFAIDLRLPKSSIGTHARWKPDSRASSSGDRPRAASAYLEQRRAGTTRTARLPARRPRLAGTPAATVRERRLAGAFWPSRRERLVLLTALAEPPRALAAWRELRPELDIQTVEDRPSPPCRSSTADWRQGDDDPICLDSRASTATHG